MITRDTTLRGRYLGVRKGAVARGFILVFATLDHLDID